MWGAATVSIARAPITTHRKGQISGELSQLGDAPRSLAVAPVRKVASLFPSTRAYPRAHDRLRRDRRNLDAGFHFASRRSDRGGRERRRGWFSARRHFRDCRAWPARCFLRRNGYPYQVLDAINDPDVVMERFGVLPKELPVMLCPNGSMKLTARGFNQAFGAEIAIPLEVAKLDCGGTVNGYRGSLKLELKNGKAIRSKTVSPQAPATVGRRSQTSPQFEGAGVSYWASPVEAKLCEGVSFVPLHWRRSECRMGRASRRG